MNQYPILFALATLLLGGCDSNSGIDKLGDTPVNLPYSSIKPAIFPLDLPGENGKSGGLIAADVNDDGKTDFIITQDNYISAYSHSGAKLWAKNTDIQVTGRTERQGLPGLHGPGVQAADIDGDQKTEVLFLTRDNVLHIVQGANGKNKHRVQLASPPGTQHWEHVIVANFRGQGDRDLLLQATTNENYRLGRYLAAYSIESLVRQSKAQPLWEQDAFHSPAHNGARVVDLDGDGKDEIVGGNILDAQGQVMFQLPLKLRRTPHIDSIFVADVRPEIAGLEVLALEEGGDNRIFLYNAEQLIWQTHHKNQEPQNAALGDFDVSRPGLEIWCRSRYDQNQKPFVFDAQGKFIGDYEMTQMAPRQWTVEGVEVIFAIDWTGEDHPLAAAKERHKSGDVAIFEPIGGKFLHKFQAKADRLYVADVSGDWREEVIILNPKALHIYQNNSPNPHPNRPRLWEREDYRRSKMTWNYYSP